jgi:hypothetical protein
MVEAGDDVEAGDSCMTGVNVTFGLADAGGGSLYELSTKGWNAGWTGAVVGGIDPAACDRPYRMEA